MNALSSKMFVPSPTVVKAVSRPLQAPKMAVADRVSFTSPSSLSWNESFISPVAMEKATSAVLSQPIPRPKLDQNGVAGELWNQLPASSMAELAARYFSHQELQALNSGSYHDAAHPLVVADAVGGFARGLGWSPERREFMQQVALLHDADDRSQAGSREVRVGTPARAQVTLEWMEQNKATLCQRFGWNEEQHLEAQALIARTDFPFNDQAKAPMGTRFDGQSPLQVYRQLLSKLSPEAQTRVLSDGQALRFADQAGFYAGSFDQAVESVSHLNDELCLVGVPSTLKGSLTNTPGFLATMATDDHFDRQLASELGIAGKLRDRQEMLNCWDASKRANFESNGAKLDILASSLKSVPGELSPEKLESLKQVSETVYRWSKLAA